MLAVREGGEVSLYWQQRVDELQGVVNRINADLRIVEAQLAQAHRDRAMVEEELEDARETILKLMQFRKIAGEAA